MPGSIEGNVEVYVLVFISNLFRYRFNSVQLYLNDWGLECVLFRLDFIFCVGFEYYNVLGKFRLEFSVSSRKGSFDMKVNINIIESILPIDTPTFPTNVWAVSWSNCINIYSRVYIHSHFVRIIPNKNIQFCVANTPNPMSQLNEFIRNT